MAVSVSSSRGASAGSMKTMSIGVIAVRAVLWLMSSAPLMMATSSALQQGQGERGGGVSVQAEAGEGAQPQP